MEVPQVPQAYRRKISLLEKAVKLFWLRFFQERSDFRAFALTQTDHFPPSFIDRLIVRLDRARWPRPLDSGYEIPRKIVARLVALFADPDPDQFLCSIYDLEKRVKKRADRERKKLLAITMEVPQADRRETSLLEDAVELFWDRFFPERSFFRAFALTQTDQFPPSFIDRLIEGLNRVRWTRHLDPGYKIPRKIMARLVALFADPDQFICSIYDLEKRVKKKADKKRKKLSAIPPWDLSVIEKSIHQFWLTFSSLDGADLRSFAESQANNFPHNYIAEFLDRLDRAGWSQLSDSDHKLPLKLMSRLASSMCKAPEMVDDCFSLVMRMEAEMEAEVRRAEAEKIALEAQLRRQERDAAAAAVAAREKAEKAEKSAQRKARKRIAREKNNLNRIGAKSLGIQ
ncbi:unnamed protein product [Arabidopsis halleri]